MAAGTNTHPYHTHSKTLQPVLKMTLKNPKTMIQKRLVVQVHQVHDITDGTCAIAVRQ